ncbi:hypothetical protein A0H81_04831 [Grifola frondosa]|uniref:Uncharacterized protein n=1 Tax=Grifola frondosa TaxID=5627 RepID=A0A1C7MFB8_GRIFR|nr:hypothetical protein A0H81_04831 [Grifola frondosa]
MAAQGAPTTTQIGTQGPPLESPWEGKRTRCRSSSIIFCLHSLRTCFTSYCICVCYLLRHSPSLTGYNETSCGTVDVDAVRDGQRIAGPHTWRGRLLRFGERLFGHKRGQRWMLPAEGEDIGLEKLRAVEEARRERDMEKLIGAYEYSRTGSSRQPSPLPSLRDTQQRRSPAGV